MLWQRMHNSHVIFTVFYNFNCSDAEQDSTSVKVTKYFREGMSMWGLELPDFTDPNVDNPVADTTDLPHHWSVKSYLEFLLAHFF